MKMAFFDTKPYDRIWFDRLKDDYGIKIKYYESKLNSDSVVMAKDYDGVIAFVNDDLDKSTIDTMVDMKMKLIALRCAGYNNVDLKAAKNKIDVVRVPKYSPYAVAEHAIGLLLCLNRRIHRAYIRTKDFNFSLNGLTGFDLRGKTVGVIGTGKIGQVFIDICRGFGMKILAYDIYPSMENVEYTDIDTLCKKSDIISLHCPLTKETKHIISKKTIEKMKPGVFILNTSRGALINSDDLAESLKNGKIGGAALDVYEEESDIFFEDRSSEIINDDTLRILLSMPNVLITSHQAFLTNEALENIARVTLENIHSYFEKNTITNKVEG
ncbi:MAG: 2-hydroxyacid dehydrogenase [Clostridia bacterium]|nr:2-hydroxyacid dehydrogenase [Clostridia bacterium]